MNKIVPGKRKDAINWEEYFMGIAKMSAMRSKDPRTQVGCCIVDSNNRILSMGYNGFPRGCSDDEFPWNSNDDTNDNTNTKYMYVVHSELNAILNYKGESLEGSTLYVTMFPCNECAKAIIQSGIKKVVYMEDKYKFLESGKATVRMFECAGVKYEKYTGRNVEITVK